LFMVVESTKNSLIVQLNPFSGFANSIPPFFETNKTLVPNTI